MNYSPTDKVACDFFKCSVYTSQNQNQNNESNWKLPENYKFNSENGIIRLKPIIFDQKR